MCDMHDKPLDKVLSVYLLRRIECKHWIQVLDREVVQTLPTPVLYRVRLGTAQLRTGYSTAVPIMLNTTVNIDSVIGDSTYRISYLIEELGLQCNITHDN